ncbi:hypothetical protein F4X10_04310, partial [Candidatus Poribacteria bacterium]|nr:hypothetical protein [Candidatus Poribacteria bacterium]
MQKITTRKIVLGILMALVLSFGVQGVVDALTLTATSSVSQSGRMGSTFDMTFRVGLTGNTVQNDSNNRRINANDHDSPYQPIDDKGYELFYIPGTNSSYRTLDTQPTAPTGTVFVVDPRPQYSTNSDGTAADPAVAGTVTTPLLVNTNGRLYDSAGKAVYIQSGSGSRSSPWRYRDATGYSGNTKDKVADTSALHDYNDEAIEFFITRPTDGSGILKLTGSSYVLPGRNTDESSATTTDVTSNSLQEMMGTIGLPGTIKLVYEDASVGTHTIKVWDATPILDFPLNALPSSNRPRQSITFTIHVTPATAPTTGTDNILPDIQRRPVDDDVVPVSGYLAFESAPGTPNTNLNRRIRYEVVRGSGTLYVGTLEKEYDTPTPNSRISVHQASNVYLKTKGTSNEIHVWFASEDRSAPRATIIFEYKGQPVPTARTTTTTTNQQNQQNQQQTTPNRLDISLSGSGNTRTVDVNALQAGTTSTSGIFTTLTTTGGTLSVPSGATPLTSTWTLPSAAGTYSVTATTTAGYTSASESVTVTVPGTLTARQDGGTVVVTASPAPTSNLAFTLTTSGGVYAGRGEILSTGTGRAIPILTTGSHILTVTAQGYNATQVSFTPGAAQQPSTTTTTGQQQQATGGSTPTGTASR